MRRFRTLVGLLCAAGCCAQVAIDPERYRPLVRYLDPQPGETPFSCAVRPIAPALNFSFRFQAGYYARVPLAQFTGAGHRWEVIVEVAPRGGGPPAYFGQQLALPEVPPTRNLGQFAGGYLIGEGSYHARFAIVDDRRRVCRAEWSIVVKPRPSERRVKVPMPPRTVSEFTWENVLHLERGATDARARNLTVLLDVAPLVSFRTRLRPSDHLLLLTMVSAALERIPARRVRLVAFSLDQQREIFRRDSLAPGDLHDLARELQGVELGTVDYHVLQNRNGYRDLLSKLVEQEAAASPPSDTVLFLGPAVRYLDKMPAGSLPQPGESGPRFYYLQYRPVLRRAISYLPDVIDSAVSRMKGKNFVIRTPADFEKAIEHLM